MLGLSAALVLIGIVMLGMLLYLVHQHRAIEDLQTRLTGSEAESARLQAAAKNLTWKTLGPGLIQELTNQWADNRIGPTQLLFDDPVYRQLRLPEELSDLVGQPLVQRLNLVRQLSFSYLHFRNSTHTRLAHTLGVCRNVQKAIVSLFGRPTLYRPGSSTPNYLPVGQYQGVLRKAIVAALLHDVGHGPFGHALDRFAGYVSNIKDELDKSYSRKYIQDYFTGALVRVGIDPTNLQQILNPDEKNVLQGADRLISDLIDSPLDVDRMDYLVRDSQMTGLTEGSVNVDALLERAVVLEKDHKYLLAFEESAVEYIFQLLNARSVLYARCYEHPTKVCGERLLVKAVQDLRETLSLSVDLIMLLTDDQLLTLMRLLCDPDSIAYNLAKCLSKAYTFDLVEEVSASDPEKLSTRVNSWQEDVVAGNFTLAYVDTVNSWERDIGREIGLLEKEWWKVCVVCPPPSLSGENKTPHIELVRIVNGQLEVRSFHQVLRERLGAGKEEDVFETLEGVRKMRTKFRVFVYPELTGEQKGRAKQAARSLFLK